MKRLNRRSFALHTLVPLLASALPLMAWAQDFSVAHGHHRRAPFPAGAGLTSCPPAGGQTGAAPGPGRGGGEQAPRRCLLGASAVAKAAPDGPHPAADPEHDGQALPHVLSPGAAGGGRWEQGDLVLRLPRRSRHWCWWPARGGREDVSSAGRGPARRLVLPMAAPATARRCTLPARCSAMPAGVDLLHVPYRGVASSITARWAVK